MEETVYHVVPSGDQWAVKKVGAEQNSRVTRTKAAAVDAARGFAQTQAPSRVVLHRRNGTISGQMRYEADDGTDGADGSGRWLSWRPSTTSSLVTLGVVAVGAAAAGYWWSQLEQKEKSHLIDTVTRR